MSDDAYGATVAKRRLSRQLLQLRVKSGYTANHVCDMLNWGRGKVGRFEANQWKRPEMSDIRDLLRVYGVDPAERDEIEVLAIRSRARPWWRDCAEIFENEFPGFENDASRIRVFIPLVLPGLLQTQEYGEAFMKIGPRPAWRREAPRDPAAAAGDPRPHERAHPRADRHRHRGLAALPVGDQGRPAGSDPAPDQDRPAPQRGPAHPALRRRAAPRPDVADQHLRLPRWRAIHRLHRDRHRHSGGDRHGACDHVQPILRSSCRWRPRA